MPHLVAQQVFEAEPGKVVRIGEDCVPTRSGAHHPPSEPPERRLQGRRRRPRFDPAATVFPPRMQHDGPHARSEHVQRPRGFRDNEAGGKCPQPQVREALGVVGRKPPQRLGARRDGNGKDEPPRGVFFDQKKGNASSGPGRGRLCVRATMLSVQRRRVRPPCRSPKVRLFFQGV